MAGVKLYALPGEKLADFRAQNLGFVFQSFHLIPYLTALENVMLPLAIAKMDNREKRTKAKEALEQVGLEAKVDRLPSQLSGGEQERVAIARAIVNKPHILLADEPTGNLDTKTSVEVMALFRELNKSGQTVVMVTHNPENCAYADRTIVLKDGHIVLKPKDPSLFTAGMPVKVRWKVVDKKGRGSDGETELPLAIKEH